MTQRNDILKELWEVEDKFIRSAIEYPEFAVTNYGYLELKKVQASDIWEDIKASDSLDDDAVQEILLNRAVNLDRDYTNPRVYANRIEDLQYLLRQVDGASAIATAASERNTNKVRQIAKDMAEDNAASQEDLPDALDIATRLQERMLGDRPPVYMTGMDKVDKIMGGFMEGTVTVLGAIQGDGKTTLAVI